MKDFPLVIKLVTAFFVIIFLGAISNVLIIKGLYGIVYLSSHANRLNQKIERLKKAERIISQQARHGKTLQIIGEPPSASWIKRKVAGLKSKRVKYLNDYRELVLTELKLVEEGKADSAYVLFYSKADSSLYYRLLGELTRTNRGASLRGKLSRLRLELADLINYSSLQKKLERSREEFHEELTFLYKPYTSPEDSLILARLDSLDEALVKRLSVGKRADPEPLRQELTLLINRKYDQLGKLSSQIELKAETVKKESRAILLPVFLLGLVLAFYIALRLTSPIKKLRQATHQAVSGNFPDPIPVKSRDEIGELTADFNRMVKELKELDEVKKSFISSVTHDLKSPLARLKGNITNLSDGLLGSISPGQQKVLSKMEEDITLLSSMIYALLDLSKLDAKSYPVNYEKVELVSFLRGYLPRRVEEARTAGIKLTGKIDSSRLEVTTDPRLLERILDNLISNSLRFTLAGGSISIGVKSADSRLLFSVSDTGVGIPAEDLPRIFDPFHKSRRGKGGRRGSGLGLAITKGFIELLGGKIWIESDEGYGTVCFFTLPREPAKPLREDRKI